MVYLYLYSLYIVHILSNIHYVIHIIYSKYMLYICKYVRYFLDCLFFISLEKQLIPNIFLNE